MNARTRRTVFFLAVAAVVAGCGAANDERGAITVFAAASLRDVVQEIGGQFEQNAGVTLYYNFAGSNVLARQIESSPKADVYLSANPAWMDYVDKRGLTTPGTRATFLSNRLVVIAPANSDIALNRPEDLFTLPFEHFSIADPESVPAGRYAKEWLESISRNGQTLYDAVADRIAPAPDVRAALAVVEANANSAGVVYRTDAASSDRVKTIYEVSAADGPHIEYVIALIGAEPKPAARAFLDFVRSPTAVEIFERHGFVTAG